METNKQTEADNQCIHEHVEGEEVDGVFHGECTDCGLVITVDRNDY